MLNQALPEQDLTFDDYVLVDTDIALWGALSDAEIVALDHNNTESDEDESEELTPVTLSEAKVSLNKLRNFSLQSHVDADILQASFVLEKSIDKLFSRHKWGCGSPVVKVSNHGRYVMSSIQVPLKTRRVGQRCTLNLSRAETSSRWCEGYEVTQKDQEFEIK
ncbi:hypothetical protein TNCV_1896281 [Trichonephila clavipes]|nr:hypothetical protein TNCV_1896281 [Trichonephila clavipes]